MKQGRTRGKIKMVEPNKKIQLGNIQVAQWIKEGKNTEGKEYKMSTYTFQKSYKDDKDEWQNTQVLNLNDIPKLISALTEMYDEGLRQ